MRHALEALDVAIAERNKVADKLRNDARQYEADLALAAETIAAIEAEIAEITSAIAILKKPK